MQTTTFDVHNTGLITGDNKQSIVSKTSDYTITLDDIDKGRVIVADTTSGDVTFTLPLLSTLPSDGYLRNFSIGHSGGANNVYIQTNATDNFVFASVSKKICLGSSNFHFTIAGLYTGSVGRWGFQRNVTIKASGHRDSNWASSNFSSNTIIPFDSEAYNNNDELLLYTSGASSRYTVKTSGSYKIAFQVDLDSTGGGTWNALAQVYKNGVALDTLQARTGNYGNEDQSMSSISSYVDLVADDYIDLRIDQNNLTGNLIHAILNIEIRL